MDTIVLPRNNNDASSVPLPYRYKPPPTSFHQANRWLFVLWDTCVILLRIPSESRTGREGCRQLREHLPTSESSYVEHQHSSLGEWLTGPSFSKYSGFGLLVQGVMLLCLMTECLIRSAVFMPKPLEPARFIALSMYIAVPCLDLPPPG